MTARCRNCGHRMTPPPVGWPELLVIALLLVLLFHELWLMVWT